MRATRNLSIRSVSMMVMTTVMLGAWFALSVLAQAQSSVPGSSTTSAMTPTGMSPGSPAGTYAFSGFDNVNLFNGNLNFRLPLLAIGGRGTAGYTMMLATSTKKWQVLDTNGQPIQNATDKFTPQWKQWNTLEVGYSPGVTQERKTGVGTVVKKTCDTCVIICNVPRTFFPNRVCRSSRRICRSY
jgi:hypothetical protein